jgi:peroxiredoxin
MEKFVPNTVFKVAVALWLLGILSARAGDLTKLPSFSLPDLDGKEWKSSELKDKACIVDFWATWCNTCKETIPKLAELNSKYKDKGLTVIGISVDKGSGEKIRKAAAKLGINYLVLIDKENSLSKTFGFNGIPSLYVFDRNGNLKTAMPGYDPDQEGQLSMATEKAIEEKLAQVPVPVPLEELAVAPAPASKSGKPPLLNVRKTKKAKS